MHALTLSVFALLGACGGEPPPPDRPKPAVAKPAPAAQAAPLGPAEARYTSLGRSDCAARDAGDDEAGSVVSTCGGAGGYSVRIEAHDHGSELDLIRGGRPLGLRYDAPGWMASVTDGKIEWRARGEAPPHALIFRVKWVDASDGGNKERSTLVVARLDGDTACAIGQTTSNEQARALADDAAKRCG